MAVEVESKLAILLLGRMEELGFSIRDVSQMVGISYEYMRKCVHGGVIPSKFVLKEFSRALNIENDVLTEAAATDALRSRFGTLPQSVFGKDPSLEPVERLWGNLTDEQKDQFVAEMQVQVRKNRLHLANS